MNELTDLDQIAAIETPPAEAPTMVASVEDLMQWRAGAEIGDSFVYFSGPVLMMITRSRDVAVDRIAASVWSMYESGRVVPVSQRNGMGWIYSAQSTDNDPVAKKL